MIQLLNTHFLFNIVCNKKEYMQKIYVVYKNTMDISRKNSRILFLTELSVFFFHLKTLSNKYYAYSDQYIFGGHFLKNEVSLSQQDN